MKTTVEKITPELAAEYLKSINPNNQRKFTVSKSEHYARQMRAGHWYPTHQAIGFDTNGNLIDGQHRLNAVVKTGVTLTFNVTRDIVAKMANGSVHHAIDYIDIGYNRTVGEQLSLRYKASNGAQSQGICRSILMWATDLRKITVPVAIEIIHVYPAIKFLGVKRERNLNCAVSGALAVCLKSYPEIRDTFVASLISGADLKANSPVLKLRELLIFAKGTGGSGYTTQAFNWTLNAVHSFLTGSPVSRIKRGNAGVEFFKNAQRHLIKRIKASAGIEEIEEQTQGEK